MSLVSTGWFTGTSRTLNTLEGCLSAGFFSQLDVYLVSENDYLSANSLDS